MLNTVQSPPHTSPQNQQDNSTLDAYRGLVFDPFSLSPLEVTSTANQPRDILPYYVASGLGGNIEIIEPLRVAWLILYRALAIMDDFIDGDVALTQKSAVDLNVAAGLLLSLQLTLSRLEAAGCEPAAANCIRERFFQVALTVCAGQHCDLVTTKGSLDRAWEAAEAKTGAFFGLITWGAARTVSDQPELLEKMWQVGHNIGMLIQIGDDLNDLWAEEGKQSDIQAGKQLSMPIAFALDMLPATAQAELKYNLSQASNNRHLEGEALQSIIASGAGIFLAIKLRECALQATELVNDTFQTGEAKIGMLRFIDEFSCKKASE